MGDIPGGAIRPGADPRPVVADLDYVLGLTNALPPDGRPSRRVVELGRWIAQQGLDAIRIDQLIETTLARIVAAGIPVSRFQLSGSTLHPEFLAFAQTWWRDRDDVEAEFYTGETPGQGNFPQSPLAVLLAADTLILRFDPRLDALKARFPLFETYAAEGATDYISEKFAFGMGEPSTFDTMVGVALSWMTDDEAGFSDQDITDLRIIAPWLAMAVRIRGEMETLDTLLSVFLGADAGQRVARGQIRRGDVVSLRAAILYADLRSFTAVSTQLETAQLVDLLNDYLGHIVAGIEEEGGQVLKFIGDGILAIFPVADGGDEAATVQGALRAANKAMASVERVNGERGDMPTCPGIDVALHIGEVLYGNVGATHRLDFTVIGSSVNAISRLEGLCQPLSAPIIMSDEFARCGGKTISVRSLGCHKLRGLAGEMEVFAPA